MPGTAGLRSAFGRAGSRPARHVFGREERTIGRTDVVDSPELVAGERARRLARSEGVAEELADPVEHQAERENRDHPRRPGDRQVEGAQRPDGTSQADRRDQG